MNVLTKNKDVELQDEIKKLVDIFQSHIGRVSYQESEEKIRRSLLNSKELMSLYSRRDGEELFYNYLMNLVSLKNELFTEEDSLEFIVAKIYEYIRFTTYKENIASKGDKKFLDDLAISSVSPLFTGKTSDLGTVRLVRDLLPNDIDILVSSIEDAYSGVSHPILIINNGNKFMYLDPLSYNGTLASLNDKLIVRYNYSSVEPLQIEKDVLKSVRKDVAKQLISDLKIDEISERIISDDMSDFDKQCAIISYLETILNTSSVPVNFNTVTINGKIMELGRVMELFFIHNKIAYGIKRDEINSDIYKVKIDNVVYHLDPSMMYNANLGKITEKLHYIDEKGDRNYVFENDDNLSKAYEQKLYKGYYMGMQANEEVFGDNRKSLVI